MVLGAQGVCGVGEGRERLSFSFSSQYLTVSISIFSLCAFVDYLFL
jgi:hypothetical protein